MKIPVLYGLEKESRKIRDSYKRRIKKKIKKYPNVTVYALRG